MDWRDYKFWRKELRRLDETTAEFEVSLQRTIEEIAIRKQVGECLQMYEETPNHPEKVSRWRSISRYASNLRKNLPFFKKLR